MLRGLQKTEVRVHNLGPHSRKRTTWARRSLNSTPIKPRFKMMKKILFLMLILILAFQELKSMEHYLLVIVEHHQYNLTNRQGPAFVRLQRCLQVNVKSF